MGVCVQTAPCCLGLGGGPDGRDVKVVAPDGCPRVSTSVASTIKLLHMEFGAQIFVWWSFRLKWVEPRLLQGALGKVLGSFPVFCGSIQGKVVKLTNAGVSFATLRSKEATAPYWHMKHGDPYGRAHIIIEHSSPMAVEMTCYQDGSAVLAIGFSHKVADGMTAWNFMNTWAETAQSQAMFSSHVQEVDVAEIMGTSKCDQFGVDGRRARFNWAHEISRRTFPDLRTTVAFSHRELANLKAAIVQGMRKDAWITTQEALTAHLLSALGQVLYREPCRAGICFVLDVRRLIGLPASYRSGAGIITFPVVVPGDLHALTLADVADCLHRSLQGLTKEKARGMWALREAAAKDKTSTQYLSRLVSHFCDCNLVIVVNNQGKMPVPDFGRAGGLAETLWSSSGGPGQVVVLPTTNGLALHLGLLPGVLARSRPARMKEVVQQLHKMPECREFDI
mmetsp:Transcript_20678/g.57987  ORF Transcript_20678/g.57987 Transcript_20678/m.57987 type:complete len:450 (+) Transcript_20678:82-1431(+)